MFGAIIYPVQVSTCPVVSKLTLGFSASDPVEAAVHCLEFLRMMVLFATAGVVNNTTTPIKIKTMDRRLNWLRCRESQGRFRYYWASGNLIWRDYSTKHYPPSIMNPEECNYQEIQSKTSIPSKVTSRVYCSWCQVELTSTWNPHTPCIHGYINTETYPRLEQSPPIQRP